MQEQQSLLFLWIVSVLVLLALDTVVTVYAAALRDQAPELWADWGKVEVAVYLIKMTINVRLISFLPYQSWSSYCAGPRHNSGRPPVPGRGGCKEGGRD